MFNGLRPLLCAALIGLRRRPVFIFVAALGTLWLTALVSQHFAAAEEDYLLIEARVAAQRHDDGRVEVVLEVRRDSAGWVEQIRPVHRFFPDPAPIGVWWSSTPPVTVPGVPGQFGIIARRDARGRVELGVQRVSGVHWGERLLPRSGRLDSPIYGPYTSPIDLLDQGPPLCALGAVVRRGERCRFPGVRDEFVVELDGSARNPLDPYNALGVPWPQPSTIAADTQHTGFFVPFLHGSHRGSTASRVLVQRLGHGGFLITRMGRDLPQPVNGADCTEGLLVPFGHYCGPPTTTERAVWFVAYASGLAHFVLRNHELSWIGELELHAETTPAGNLPHYALDAVREAAGWRITRMIAPAVRTFASSPAEIEDCAPGRILQPGDRCSDPTTTRVFGITTDGGWSVDGGPPTFEARGTWPPWHPSTAVLGFQPLGSGAWIVDRIHTHRDDPAELGDCTIGLVVYPAELCRWTGIGWFRVFRDGLANVGPHVSRERIAVVGHERRFSGDRLTLYDFTAERQSDGGFLVSAMRQRWPLLEAQVQRQRGDCFAGLILGVGDGCRYPSSSELLVVRQDGSARFGAIGGRYTDGFRFVPWGGVNQESVLYEPLRDGGQIVVRIGADAPPPMGICVVGLAVSPGQSCRAGPDLPRFYVFYDAALFDGVASHNDLEVEGDDRAPRLRAERQPDRSYIIRELAPRS